MIQGRDYRSDMNTDDQVVANWTEQDGLVVVDGKVVQGAYGTRTVAVRRSTHVTCQRCKQVNVEVPLVLLKRYEHALGREMFWFGVPPEPYRMPERCIECRKIPVPHPDCPYSSDRCEGGCVGMCVNST